MNVLDENIPDNQRLLLHRQRIHLHQIGLDLGRKGMKDRDIIRLLHSLDRPTLFTLDGDFYDRHLCHAGYYLVYLDLDEDQVSEHVRRALRHRELNNRAKRMGCVIRVSPAA